MKILAVDGNRDMRETYADWLADSGYELTCVANREDAAVALARSRWDAVLLDQNLLGPAGGPVGLELVETIRAFSPAAAIVVISGAVNLSIKRAFELGTDDYLVKDQYAANSRQHFRTLRSRSGWSRTTTSRSGSRPARWKEQQG